MRMNDNFNIITGEIKQQYSSSTHNKRFTSLDIIRKSKESTLQQNHGELPSFNHRKLGTAQDSKLYQYSYVPRNSSSAKGQPLKTSQEKQCQLIKKQSEPISLINATKTTYNIITHAHDATSNPNWQVTKRKCPVSRFTELGRTNAPNYSDTYKDQIKFGKRDLLCNTACEMQRSYGTDKFFRKFK